jgi:hypothetical protein
MKPIIIAAMLAATSLTVAAQSKIYSKQTTYVLKETEAEGVDAHVGVFKINASSKKATYTLYYWANGMAYKNHVLADSTHFNLKAKVKIEVPADATAEEVRNAISKNIIEAINKENVPDILKMRLMAFFTGAVNDKYKIAASKADHIFFPVWADNRINGIKLRQGNFEIHKD